MQDLSPLLNFIERVGVPAALIFLVAWWVKPRMERWFESQCQMFDSVCKRLDDEPKVDKKKLRAIGRVGTMVYEAAPDEKRGALKPHLDELHRESEST